MKNINYTLTAETVALIEKMKKAAATVQTALEKNVHVDKFMALSEAANKARVTANKSHQTDVFDALLKTDAPLVSLCEMGTFSADSFTISKEKGLSFTKVETVLSLSAFIAYANSKGVLSLGASYQSDVIDAIKIAAIQTAGELKVAPSSYIKRLNLSDSARAVVLNPLSGEVFASRSDVKTVMQKAINAIFGLTDGGKPLFFCKSEDAFALSRLFGTNRVNGSMVIPQDSTMMDMFFYVLRHIVGGMEYSVEIKEARKSEKKEGKKA